ncbi:MAG: hypothetical protein JWM78_891 [Verrucomicrobiaceae bacterium]|nr:hypothetical protein [Verrucomicrobiaceae bacterium]
MNAETRLLRTATNNAHAGTDAAVHLAHDLIDRAAKHLEVSEEKLRKTAHDAEQAVKVSLRAARTRSLQAGDSAKNVLQSHPVAALSLAVSVGALFAIWFRGRDRSPTETVEAE